MKNANGFIPFLRIGFIAGFFVLLYGPGMLLAQDSIYRSPIEASVSDMAELTFRAGKGKSRHNLIQNGSKIAEVIIGNRDFANISLRLPAGIIEAGELNEEKFFLAVIPYDGSPVYLELPFPDSDMNPASILSSFEKMAGGKSGDLEKALINPSVA